jgi:hypothetical protein
MIGSLRQLWRNHFRDNPLLRREAGLWEGRSLWFAPIVWAFAFAMLQPLWTFLCTTDFLRELIPPPWGLLTLTVTSVASLPSIWFTARAWGRDREPAARSHIATSSLTLRQILGAKALIWLTPLAIACVLTFVLQSTWLTWILRDDFSRAGFSALCEFVAAHFFYFVGSLSLAALQIGLVTRLALVSFRPLVSFVVAAGLVWALGIYPTWLLNRWFEVGTRFQVYLVIALESLLPLAMAVAVWWGLPRHVARVYGMEVR